MHVGVRYFESHHSDANAKTGNLLFDGVRYLFGKDRQRGQQLIIQVEIIVDLSLGYHQGVALRQWVDVEKGQAPVVFGHDMSRNLSPDDASEQGSHDLIVSLMSSVRGRC